MTTENKRENATLGREGVFSAHNSTRCMPYALKRGRLGNRRTDEALAGRAGNSLKQGSGLTSRGCHPVYCWGGMSRSLSTSTSCDRDVL